MMHYFLDKVTKLAVCVRKIAIYLFCFFVIEKKVLYLRCNKKIMEERIMT